MMELLEALNTTDGCMYSYFTFRPWYTSGCLESTTNARLVGSLSAAVAIIRSDL
jgi:hypothetical protein